MYIVNFARIIIKNEKLKEFFKETAQLQKIYQRFTAIANTYERIRLKEDIYEIRNRERDERASYYVKETELRTPDMDKNIYEASRRMEYALIDKNIILCMSFFILLITLGSLVVVVLMYFAKEKSTSADFSPTALIKHLLLTLLLPLILYEIFKLMPFSTHAWSLKYSFVYLMLEKLILFAVLSLSIFLWQRKNSRQLVESGMNKTKDIYIFSVCSFFFVFFLYTNTVVNDASINNRPQDMIELKSMSELFFHLPYYYAYSFDDIVFVNYSNIALTAIYLCVLLFIVYGYLTSPRQKILCLYESLATLLQLLLFTDSGVLRYAFKQTAKSLRSKRQNTQQWQR